MNTLCSHDKKLSICSNCAGLTKNDVTLGEEEKQQLAEIITALCGSPGEASAALTRAFQQDPLLACAWHASLVKCIMDAHPEREVYDYDYEFVANEAANLFMLSAFNITFA